MNGFLKKVMPWIGAAATGGVPALAGMAVKEISEILGKKIDPASMAGAVAAATPEQLIKLRELDKNYELRFREMGFQNEQELERIGAEDRASARAREIAVKDNTPKILAYGITAGFFGVLAYMLNFGIPHQGGEALLVMLGSLGTAWVAVVSYYYGSSRGSDRKTEIMANKGAENA